MYKRLLVPLDKSDRSLKALPYAKLIARALGAKVELTYIVPWARSSGIGAMLQVEPWTDIQQALTDAAHGYLSSIAGPLRNDGFEVGTAVLVGVPADEIKAEAKSVPDTLIVMTTNGESGLGRWTLGSVAGKVVYGGVCPTLCIRSGEATLSEGESLSTIILPLDGSTASESALPHAAAVAAGLGAKMVILRAVGPEAYGYHDFSDIAPEAYARLHDAIEKEADGYLNEVEARLHGLGVDQVQRAMPVDGADAAIVKAAGEETHTMVVMTSYIRRSPDGITFGSVTDRVVRHSPAPVLVVPPVREEAEGSASQSKW
jgi:nucleotide-binding universal stress UspA family protein